MGTSARCDRCCFYAHSPHLVCALHPAGPTVHACPDFESALPDEQRQTQAWLHSSSWLPLQLHSPQASSDDWMSFWIAEPDD